MLSKNCLVVVGLLLVSALGLGCGSGEKTVKVSGVVKVEGKPLSKGDEPSVTLYVEGSKVRTIQVDKSNGTFSGEAVVGKTKVTATAYPSPAEAGIAKKYTSIDTTTLEIEVTADGPNEFELEVGEAGK
jgi:hypothetical protein